LSSQKIIARPRINIEKYKAQAFIHSMNLQEIFLQWESSITLRSGVLSIGAPLLALLKALQLEVLFDG
jgi:hypothetical protein